MCANVRKCGQLLKKKVKNMLIFDLMEIGNRLYEYRKRKHLTQAQLAEKAGLSDRAYAEIERGNANMRLETFLKICESLEITPNDILVKKDSEGFSYDELKKRLENCTEKEKQAALDILRSYTDSL